MSTGALRFWVSWAEPVDAVAGEDPRPIKWPLPASIPHWWCTGGDGECMTICAIVDVNGTEESAKRLIAEHWAPQSWRFVQNKGWAQLGWMPESSRFPVKAKGGAR